jgi:two-component system nitrogen regulation sensor histidine kinase GlnL
MTASAYPGLELLATAVLMLDGELRLRYANPAAENLLAQGRKHLLGHEIHKALPGNLAFHAILRQALEWNAGYNEHEASLEVAGQAIRLHCAVSPIDHDGARLLVELLPLEQQLKIAREEKLLEQQSMNRELLRNLAHEIKNPLGGIRGSAQLLERELPEPELKEFTQVIVKEADRLQALMNRLLAPSRLPQLASVNIHEVTERVRALVLAEFSDGLTVRRDYDTSLPEITADREQLIQALLNVARNAAQAMQGKGEIGFVTRIVRQVTLARERFRHAILVQIVDNGPGVPAALQDRIFYPLVTGRDGGTGLGLSLAQDYVNRHHGVIEFESVPGRTCFSILLPVRDNVVPAGAPH